MVRDLTDFVFFLIQEVGKPYEIKTYPTLIFFGGINAKPQKYEGKRNTKNIVNYSITEMKKITSKRLRNESDNNGGGNDSDKDKIPDPNGWSKETVSVPLTDTIINS